MGATRKLPTIGAHLNMRGKVHADRPLSRYDHDTTGLTYRNVGTVYLNRAT